MAFPASHCPKCGYKLRAVDNIPVLSYIFLGGKCHNCKAKISFRYTAVELLNMILWLGAVWKYWDGTPLGIAHACILCVMFSLFICVAFIDLEHKVIYDVFSIILGVLAIGTVFTDPNTVWWEHLIGLGIALGGFLLIELFGWLKFKREALGWGDVEIAVVMGLMLGWKAFLFGIIIAALPGSIILLVLQKTKKQDEQTEYPFAPFLTVGAVVAALWGTQLMDAYFALIAG